MMRPKLQLALDLVKLEPALEIARAAAPWVEIIEAGTPLIKSVGIVSVRGLKHEFPDKLICADMKTADAGRLEASLAVEAGADLITVLASAPKATIRSVIAQAHSLGSRVMIDCLGVEPRNLGLADLAPDYLEIHTGLDEQGLGLTPLEGIRKAQGLGIPLAVAGGMDLKRVEDLAGLDLAIIVVGSGITRAQDPGDAAQLIKQRIKELWR